MIKQKVYLRWYDWYLTVIYEASQALSAVADELWSMQCPSSLALGALELITVKNTGFCYTDYAIKSTLICVAETDSDDELVNTVVHELKHFQSHVCEYYGISEKGEEAAYLIGDTCEELYKKFKYELDKSKGYYLSRY